MNLVLPMNTQVESKASINAWFYKSASNAIEWYLAGIQTELRWLQWSGPIKIDDAGEIADVSDEIVMAKNTLMRAHPKTDWQSFRSWIDDIQARAAGIVKNVENTRSKVLAKEAINIAKAISSAEVKSVAENMEQVQEKAWGAMIDSWRATFGDLERIKKRLCQDGFSYDSITNTIITSARNMSPHAGGIQSLDMTDIEEEKAAAHVQVWLWYKATAFSIQVNHDLGKHYGDIASNEENIKAQYNTLSEAFSDSGKWDPIDMKVPGFSKFSIVTHEKNAGSSRFHTLVIHGKRLWSGKLETYKIICDPEEIRSGIPTRVGIEQPNGKTKIELLNVNCIQKNEIIIPVLTDRVEDPTRSLKPQSVWDKAKTSAKNTWNNWFSKKAA